MTEQRKPLSARDWRRRDYPRWHPYHYFEPHFGCGPIGCVTMLATVGMCVLLIMGCSPSKPDSLISQSTVEAEREEESAVAIEGHDLPVEDDIPVVLPSEPNEPDHPCDCSPTCPCSKDRCLCATGEKCSEACTCQPKKAHDWREVYANGRWWYYQPDKTWRVWDGQRWQRYQPRGQYQGGGGKTNWFGGPKRFLQWRNGLFMGADTSSSAGCRT